MTNPNGTIAKSATKNATRINVGKTEHTQTANLNDARKSVLVGQVAVLPGGAEWLKVRGGWELIQEQGF